MRDEWRFVSGTEDCFVNLDGEVQQAGHILEPYKQPVSGDHRWVTAQVSKKNWDYDERMWIGGEETLLVWQLMKQAWFTNWPSNCQLFFVDGDPFNCSADNIRAWSKTDDRMIMVREDEWGFSFDKRLQGQVEILELGITAAGPAEAARLVGGTKSGVSLVLSNRLKTHKGFTFRWV